MRETNTDFEDCSNGKESFKKCNMLANNCVKLKRKSSETNLNDLSEQVEKND